MAAYDLTTNPFWLLKTSIHARQRDIVDAFELAISDETASEADLTRAQQILLAPMTRLEAELSWLPELSPAHAGAIVGALASNPPKETALRLQDGLEGLSGVSLAADICRRYPGDVALVDELVRSYQGLSLDALTETINASRTIAGFGRVDPSIVKSAFAKTVRAHAEAATSCLTVAASPGKALSDLIVGTLDPTSLHFEFLDATIRSYRAWSDLRLRRIDDAIQEEIDDLRSSPGDLGVLRSLGAGMALWSEWNSPVVLWDQAKGLDEPRAYAIYGRLRELSLWLANDMNRFKEALEITEVLRANFAILPSAAKRLDEDVTTLKGLIRNEASSASVAVLKRATDGISIPELASALLTKGFGHNSIGLAKSLYDAFDGANISVARDGRVAVDVPWKMIRSVMIDLKSQEHKEASERLGIALLTIAPGKASVEFVAVLEDDCRRTVKNNVRWLEVESLLKAGKRDQALPLLHSIIATARESDDVDQAAKLYAKIQADIAGYNQFRHEEGDRAKAQADSADERRKDKDRVKIKIDSVKVLPKNKDRVWKWVTNIFSG